MAEDEPNQGKLISMGEIFQGLEVEAILYDDDDPNPPSDEIEGGFTLSYSDDELRALGGGDEMRGLLRIKDVLEDDNRPLIERMMDPRRPLQDELDLLLPPSPTPPVN